MKGLRSVILSLFLFIGAALAVSASSSHIEWEEVSAPASTVVQSLDSEAETEIIVSGGYIYIRCDRTVTVKLFSILGQLISQETVKPGLHRLKLNSRGIYILRAGSTTRRITL